MNVQYRGIYRTSCYGFDVEEFSDMWDISNTKSTKAKKRHLSSMFFTDNYEMVGYICSFLASESSVLIYIMCLSSDVNVQFHLSYAPGLVV